MSVFTCVYVCLCVWVNREDREKDWRLEYSSIPSTQIQARSFGSRMNSNFDVCACVYAFRCVHALCMCIGVICIYCTFVATSMCVCLFVHWDKLWSASERAFDECACVCMCVLDFMLPSHKWEWNANIPFNKLSVETNECLDKNVSALYMCVCARMCVYLFYVYVDGE